MKKPRYMSWHSYFMSIAILSSMRSKDPKTQNGACIVGVDNRIIGIGYNGLPRGLNDDDKRFWADDDSDPLNSKHTYVVHAEKNAIYNCINLNICNTTIYTTQFPCHTCAQAIIQVGIKNVIFLNQKKTKNHTQTMAAVKIMFDLAKVNCQQFDSLKTKDGAVLQLFENIHNFYK